jgi:hypothetical protein
VLSVGISASLSVVAVSHVEVFAHLGLIIGLCVLRGSLAHRSVHLRGTSGHSVLLRSEFFIAVCELARIASLAGSVHVEVSAERCLVLVIGASEASKLLLGNLLGHVALNWLLLRHIGDRRVEGTVVVVEALGHD